MAVFKIEGEEVIDKTVRPRTGSSAQIYVHKKYAGRRVKVVILTDNGDNTPVPLVRRKEGVERVPGEKGDEGFE